MCLALGCKLCAHLLPLSHCVVQREGSAPTGVSLSRGNHRTARGPAKPHKHVDILCFTQVCSHRTDKNKCMTKPRFGGTGRHTPSGEWGGVVQICRTMIQSQFPPAIPTAISQSPHLLLRSDPLACTTFLIGTWINSLSSLEVSVGFSSFQGHAIPLSHFSSAFLLSFLGWVLLPYPRPYPIFGTNSFPLLVTHANNLACLLL